MAKELGLISNLKSYPPAVFLMLGNEFCERFSFYGMKAILTLYFIYEHGYTERYSVLAHIIICSDETHEEKLEMKGQTVVLPLESIKHQRQPIGESKDCDLQILFEKNSVWLPSSIIKYRARANSLTVGSHATRATLHISQVAVMVSYLKALRCLERLSSMVHLSMFSDTYCYLLELCQLWDCFSEEQQNLRSQFFSFFYFAINGGSLFAIILTPILRGRFSEEQQNLRSQFFSFFYFAINGGSLFAIILTPILRGRTGSKYEYDNDD
ncbi:unnamed protein product [Strongylus vulgaris]|uniref:Uncharacterized protein n=1 Tax=Strongylus vulgaris TaxID=40348 RepID=A0A3P7L2U4_STRVU|nr:unnamed protein product [Strongylus vulgaris]